MYRSLLVPLDGSPFSEHALPLALSIARRAEATVHLLHVHPPWATAYPEVSLALDDSLEHLTKQHEHDYLDEVVSRLKAVSPVPLSSSLVEGDIPTMIRAAVPSTQADLVVMTTHGRSPLGRFWLGSVADHLVRDLPAPLLLVRPHDVHPDLSQEPVLKHLLLPLDGTPLAEQMIEPAIALGSLMDADYTLLRVIRPPTPWSFPTDAGSLGERIQAALARLDKLEHQLRQEATDYLERMAERLRQRSLRVTTHVVMAEQPASAIILHEANPPAVDLIALETHARHGLSRLLLGSVADKVIRGAAVPVLVQRPVYR
jgi:nucleotide-binding universal stress UspA family protein